VTISTDNYGHIASRGSEPITWQHGLAMAMLLPLLCFGKRKLKRQWAQMLMLVVMLATAAGLSSCAAGPLDTPTFSGTLTITATDTAQLTRSTSVNLNIQ
jgi:hypothetical protein